MQEIKRNPAMRDSINDLKLVMGDSGYAQLDQTNDKVSDIAQALGYADPYYFSRRFKQLCGIEPLRYRRCLRLQFHRPQKRQ